MGKSLVIAEKPSVASDIANVLGNCTEHDGYFENDDYVVTFAVGHLFELLPPEEVDPKYKAWTLEVLPILPQGKLGVRPKKGHSERIRTIKNLALREDVDGFINACDAGREGELIFHEIIQYHGWTKPVRRLWLQSMTADSIRNGFETLRSGEAPNDAASDIWFYPSFSQPAKTRLCAPSITYRRNHGYSITYRRTLKGTIVLNEAEPAVHGPCAIFTAPVGEFFTFSLLLLPILPETKH